jgi:hypothetical protein
VVEAVLLRELHQQLRHELRHELLLLLQQLPRQVSFCEIVRFLTFCKAAPRAPGLMGQMAATAGGVAIGSVVGHGLSQVS